MTEIHNKSTVLLSKSKSGDNLFPRDAWYYSYDLNTMIILLYDV